MDNLDLLPDDSRLWVFSFEHEISADQELSLQADLQDYLSRWKAHGAAVNGAFCIVESRFLIVAADPNTTHVSGCSIDSLFRNSKTALAEAGISLADLSAIFFRIGEDIHQAPREQFRKLVESGTITDTTPVFDTALDSLASFRQKKFEVPYAESWHLKLFGPAIGEKVASAA